MRQMRQDFPRKRREEALRAMEEEKSAGEKEEVELP